MLFKHKIRFEYHNKHNILEQNFTIIQFYFEFFWFLDNFFCILKSFFIIFFLQMNIFRSNYFHQNEKVLKIIYFIKSKVIIEFLSLVNLILNDKNVLIIKKMWQ